MDFKNTSSTALLDSVCEQGSGDVPEADASVVEESERLPVMG